MRSASDQTWPSRTGAAWGRVAAGTMVVGLIAWKVYSGDGVHMDTRLLVAAVAVQPIVILGFLMNAVRLGVLAGLPPGRSGTPLAALLLSNGLNLLLPGRIAEFLKASYLHAHAGVAVSRGMAALFLERSVDLLIVATLSLVGVLLFAAIDATLVWAASALVVVGTFFLPALEGRLARFIARLPWPLVASFASRFLEQVSLLIRERRFFWALLPAAAAWLLSALNVIVFIVIAGSHPVDAKGMIALFVATTIGGAIPALPGGFGAYEGAAILALRPYGYDVGEAFAIGLALHLAQMVIPVMATGFILARNRSGVRALVRKLRAELKMQNGQTDA